MNGALLLSMLGPVLVTVEDQPSLLDWISGVGVPILIGGATLAVAIWAGRIAKASNELTERQHRESVGYRDRLDRSRFATAAQTVAGNTLSGQIAGMDAGAVIVDSAEAFKELAAAGHPVDLKERQTMVDFVRAFSIARPIQKGELEEFMHRTVVMRDVFSLWVEDPLAGLAKAK